MKAIRLDCLHYMPQGYTYRLCPVCIKKGIAKAMKEKESK